MTAQDRAIYLVCAIGLFVVALDVFVWRVVV
jgi:hypothetical protein